MSSLTLRLAAWNAAANPTHTRVTAVAAYRDGVACGHADGTIWLYDLTLAASSQSSGDTSSDSNFALHPKSLLSAHQSPITLLKLAEVSAPSAEGRECVLISVSDDGDVAVWSTGDGRCISRVRSALAGIRPTSLSLQIVDYQSAAEDLLFVAGEGAVAYVLSFPSLEMVHEWQLPHPEWITAQAVRKRKDHFRSELLTCTADGVVRIWSYDEFALAQQDVFSRTASPAPPPRAEHGSPGAIVGDGSQPESVDEPDSEPQERVMFSLESQFAALGEDHAITQLVVNPFNDDEFLAVSPAIVRLFASRDRELHELLRWRPQRSTSAEFAGAGFLARADIVFWDTQGTIFSVCTQFSVEGGSAGMHMARGLHADESDAAFAVATSLCSVPPGAADSALAAVSARPNARVDVLVSYASSHEQHVLSVVMPVPLSSVSGSANRPHVVPEDAKSGPRNWLGRATPFKMNALWDSWLQDVKLPRQITSALVTRADCVAVGYADGAVQVVPQALLISGMDTEDSATELCGHRAPITALYEWQAPALHHATSHSRESLGIIRQSETETAAEHPEATHNTETRSLLLSASKDLTLRIWDVDLGECLYVLSTQSAPVVFMAGVAVSGRMAAWTESSRHSDLCTLLGSLVLAVGSDNSTTLVSVSSFERIHVTAPYHAPPVRLSLCRAAGDLELHYADSTRRTIPLAHLVGSGNQEVPESGRYPELSVSLTQSRTASVGSNSNSNASDGGRWLGVTVLLRRAPALVLDIDVVRLQAAISRVVTEQTTLEEMQQLMRTNSALQASQHVLAQLCSWGISADLDKVKREVFGMLPPRHMSLSMSNKRAGVNSIVFPNRASACSSWCMSPLLNAQRMLAILVLARGVLQGSEKKAVEIINYYVGKLPSQVGRRFKPLSLLPLAQYWQSANGSLQRAARTLMLSAIHGAPERQRRAELFYWSSILARSVPGVVDSEDLHGLTIVCLIAADFPALLPLTTRSMAATMLQTLVTSERGVREQMMAIELLSRGFATFRAYLDCELVIRRLVAIMLSISEEQGAEEARGTGPSASAPGSRRPSSARLQQADKGVSNTAAGVLSGKAISNTAAGVLSGKAAKERTMRRTPGSDDEDGGWRQAGSTVSFALVGLAKAGLQRISAHDIGLVSTTLCGMLRAGSVDERWRALQALLVVVQKHAAQLHGQLEDVVGAVVGALEPKRASERRRLIGAAGACLQGLVRAYPCVAFCAETQLLAVGCCDGRCVAFDLRTATRTAVFDTQARGPVACVAISPQGDRVASFALANSVLSIWDPQPSALAMFAKSLFWTADHVDPEAQGSVAPSKTMAIPGGFLAHAEELPISSVMQVAKLTWTGDKTVLLQIQDASFSLSI